MTGWPDQVELAIFFSVWIFWKPKIQFGLRVDVFLWVKLNNPKIGLQPNRTLPHTRKEIKYWMLVTNTYMDFLNLILLIDTTI